ncbi:TPR/glycosyl transferase domain protein [Methanosarcina siciliae T4/M]|uniref:TPR/glycosyl transferase domain protein n=1 Tax=Methanosarcina siciliae T4/M TaxID=1434120 RepID=A0A0E3P608_9EURY|nr:glycosyltransferase [Methanosarcina siciliae]AKB29155.1 TPR/glycosyl transferase domain protein [Methanosarcina siciliae T4/M]
MNKVLVLCYDFSPTGGTGILRTLKFCKYLPQNQWIPVIIHAKNRNILKFLSNSPDIMFNCRRYSSLRSKLFEYIGILSDRYLKSYRYIFLPDIHIYTIIPTFLKVLNISRREQIDLLYCSCSPYSFAISGVLTKKIINKPLVVDLRDAWTLNPYEYYPTILHRKFDEMLERFVFNNCDSIIMVADVIENKYIDKYGETVSNKIHTIPNGFDSLDLQLIEPENDKFIITYTGSFYGIRKPDSFLKGLKRFVESNKPNDIEIHFYGNSSRLVEELVNKYNLSRYVFSHPFIKNKEVYLILAKSHLLLFIEPSSATPTKLFEYLSSDRPILAIIPEGEASKLIRKYSIYSCTTPESEDRIAFFIEKYYNSWKNGLFKIHSTRTEFMSEFNRENLTKRLSNIFDHLCNQ